MPWTEERRRRQAEAIQQWKPWKKSTGPRTEEGKARSSRNAYKASVKQELREIASFLAQLERERRELADEEHDSPFLERPS